ncbi:CACNA1G, partial [Symbiodinium necroappetens]
MSRPRSPQRRPERRSSAGNRQGTADAFSQELLANVADGLRIEIANALRASDRKQRRPDVARAADELQQAERDALGREILRNANQELGRRFDHLDACHVQIRSTGEYIREAVDSLSTQMSQLGSRTELLEGQKELEDPTYRIPDHKEILLEVHEAQKSAHAQLRNDLHELRDQIEESLHDRTGNVKLEALLHSLQSDLQSLRQEMSHSNECLGETRELVEFAAADQGPKVDLLKADVESGFQNLRVDVASSKKQSSQEVRLMLGEMARIQKFMGVDYLSLKSLPDVGSESPSAAARTSLRSSRTISLNEDKLVSTTGSDALGDLEKPQKESSPTRRRSFRAATRRLQSNDCLEEHASTGEAVIAAMHPIRLRDLGLQTENHTHDRAAQTDSTNVEFSKKKEKKRLAAAQLDPKKKLRVETQRASVFAGADQLKRDAQLASMKPPYNVFEYYHETGLAQRIAKSPMFENVTLSIVCLSALWIAVDADLNTAAALIDADPVFQIMENVFCTYFILEILVRFCAFQRKCNSFKDPWFVFDMILVLLTVGEVWILTLVLAVTGQQTSMIQGTGLLRMLRLVRVFRLTRMTKLLRACPELMIVLKGLAYAMRSVSVFFGVWIILIYFCSVMFRLFADGSEIGTAAYFDSVLSVMNTLFLRGIFGDNADFIVSITSVDPWMWAFLIPFLAV